MINSERVLQRMTEPRPHIPQLDGIRGMAILLVLIWHFVFIPIMWWPHESLLARVILHLGLLTWSGVDLFFVLSGFLIGGILIDAKESSNYFQTFYLRRAFRILPVYLLLIVPYLLVWIAASGHKSVLQETLGAPMPWYLYFTFTQNFWLAHHSWDSMYLTASWSLAVEEQFYLLLPLIVRLCPRKFLLRSAITLAIMSAFSRFLLYLHYGPSWGTAAYTLIISRADALMVGVICAVLWRHHRWRELLKLKPWTMSAPCLLFGLAVIILMYKGWGMASMPMCTLGFSCLALFYASILMLAVTCPDGFLSRAFQARWLMWLGTVSYGLYLFHSVALDTVSPILRHPKPSTALWLRVVTIFSALVASLFFAWLSWNYFEVNFVRLGHRFLYKDRTATRLSLAHSIGPTE
jgi:peptidoglycan/LPS O-acetylase OafA/YrhL